ncbi:hypothetical protein OK016_16625 [Vibrio chagasii]|nr:hypothetical protein [Vibrio chagasii]
MAAITGSIETLSEHLDQILRTSSFPNLIKEQRC